jgi:hypothetical protein
LKKIVEKVGVSFAHEKVTVSAPRLPRIPPRSHHQNTTPKTHFFKNTPQKHQQKQQKTLERTSRTRVFFLNSSKV